MEQNWGFLLLAIFVVIGTEIALICVRPLARKVPINFILLAIFTFAESYMVSYISSYYAADNSDTVIMAGAGTVLITLACTLYACTTKTDFTMMGGMIWCLSMSLMMLALFSWIFAFNNFMYNAITALCIFLFGIFLIYDTQLIVGKGKHKLSLDDYIVGAMIIYLDIITIFLYLLQLLGRR
jgi:protein lifeguard